jgi:hypothetical protein
VEPRRHATRQSSSPLVNGSKRRGEWAPSAANVDSVLDPDIAWLALTCCCHFLHLDPIHHHISVGSHLPGRSSSKVSGSDERNIRRRREEEFLQDAPGLLFELPCGCRQAHWQCDGGIGGEWDGREYRSVGEIRDWCSRWARVLVPLVR